MRIELVCTSLAFLLPLSAVGQARSDAETYQAACAACHGSDGRGLGPDQLAFPTPVPDFTDCGFASREPDADWFAITHQGGPVRGFDRMMPAFGDALTDGEIQASLDHIRTMCRDSRWPRGELNMPRALFTEKAYPEDEAVITTTIVTEGRNALEQELLWEQRFGPRSQIEIALPLLRADLGDPLGRESGVGDLAIGAKHALRHSLERGSILAVGGEIVLPTGDESKGFGSGTTVLEPYVAFGKLLPRNAFLQVQAFAEIPRDRDLEDELAVRAALGRTWARDGGFGRAWTPIIEVLASRELDGGAETQWDVVPQFQVTLSTRQHVMANAGFRVPVTNRAERETELVFYLLWDWFDGRLLEGW